MNFRFAFCTAIAMIVLIIISTCVFVTQKLRFSLILILVGILLLCVIFIFVFKSKKLFGALIAILLIGIIPVVSIYFKAEKLTNNQALVKNENSNDFVGRIFNVSFNLKENIIFLGLEDIVLLNDSKEKDFHGKIYVCLNANGVETSELVVGRRLKISNSKLDVLSLSNNTNKRDRSFISKGYSATTYIFAFNMEILETKSLSLRDKIKQSVYESFEGTDRFFTDIGYAMIFGESDILNENIYGVFKSAGIAHLLAVSGFHVSVIVAFLVFLLNKMKVNKYARLGIISIILTFYAYLCSFSISVIRASLMSVLLLYTGNRYKEYDKLSALSLVASLILMIDPMQLFNISFILSFVSILSIIFLMPIFERLFSKIFFDKLSSSLSVSLAVCLGLTVFQMYYFKEVTILSIISNVLTIPVVGALFIFLIASVIIGPLLGIATPLIKGFGFGMKHVVQFNNWIANNGIYLKLGGVGTLALLLSLVLMFVVSDYLFVKKKYKIPLSCGLALLLLLVMI